MVLELRARGFPAGKERVERLMRENGIHGRYKRRYKVTTDSKHGLPVAPNLLAWNFTPAAPNYLSLSDCYHRIRDLKQEARANRDRGNDFFPGVSVGGEPITSRTQADDLVLLAFKRTRRVNNMLAP